MLITRWAAVALAAVAVVAGLAMRAYTSGALAQVSGTALYATMVYAAVVFLAPRLPPVAAAAIAIGFCWAVEFFQLTGVPAELSAHSLAARLALGSAFDWADIAWYPAGVVPVALVHRLIKR